MRKNFGFQFENSYFTLPGCFYKQLSPVPVSAPETIIFNNDLAQTLGLDFSNLSHQEKAALFAGNMLLRDGGYFAQAYAGHQFGHFTMLGDGRAIVWGEHTNPDGKKFDIQFKGSGRTFYSRQADGRAALGPMLREYIISEAMHHLGIPTTRSLAVVKTGEFVLREKALPGSILTRVASSHLRIGTFEFAASQNDPHIIKSLLDYTVARHYPDIIAADNQAIALLKAVMERQADLIVHWMRVGFIHGVMNTDNMTLSGETIDYGPCAFMDSYDPKTVFSSIDRRGRYAYQNQPAIAQWNLARLAESLIPLIHSDLKRAIDMAKEVICLFSSLYQNKWLTMMRCKLGLYGHESNDAQLVEELLNWMQSNRADFTNTFRELSQTSKPIGKHYDSQSFNQWYQRWQIRLQQNPRPFDEALAMMKSVNPALIPRNHQVEQALEAAMTDNYKPLHQLLTALEKPYHSNEQFKMYQLPPSAKERVYQTFCGT